MHNLLAYKLSHGSRATCQFCQRKTSCKFMLMKCNAYFYACSEEREKEVETIKVEVAEMDIGIQNFRQRYKERVEKAVKENDTMVCQSMHKAQ